MAEGFDTPAAGYSTNGWQTGFDTAQTPTQPTLLNPHAIAVNGD